MMQQFEAAKARCPGALVLFRMGDFYELFGDDAREAAALLDLTLTSRDKGPDALPMAGFPHHQLDVQLARLVAAGRRVAICEQLDGPAPSDGKPAKGLMRREVTRIVTPGIASDESLLDPAKRNWLVAILPVATAARSSAPHSAPMPHATAGEFSATEAAEPVAEADGTIRCGLAWIDVAAGRFEAAVLPREDVPDLLLRLEPTEVLCAEKVRGAVATLVEQAAGGVMAGSVAITARPDWWFEESTALANLGRAVRQKRLEGLGFELPAELPGILAAGGIVAYLDENEPAAVGRIDSLAAWRPGHRMEIDEASRRSLEIVRPAGGGTRRDGSLASVVDRTKTPMGGRLLAEWLSAPLVDQRGIDRRLDAVATLVADPTLADRLAEALTGVGDLERLTGRVISGRAGPRDLERIGRATAALPHVVGLLAGLDGLLGDLRDAIDPCDALSGRIAATLREGCPVYARDGGYVRSGFDPRLDELVEMASGGKAWIARYQAEQIERTGIPSLKVGFNRVFGFFLEVGRAQAAKVPADYVRKQTVKNAERYTTPELDDRQRQVLGAEEESLRREIELLELLRLFAAEHRSALDRVTGILAELDVLRSLAEVARGRGWVRPEITSGGELFIEAGRHPVLEQLLSAGTLVSNDLTLAARSAGDARPAVPSILLVTGPNMGGKSTFIRQAALTAVLAQAGSFVPAKRARVGIVDRLFARIGAGDDLARGASTFLVEMAQTARILNRATPQSLVILDEVGRGTSTFDGLAIAQAVVEHLQGRVGCRTLFATHYLQLAALERLPGVANAQVLVRQHRDELVFLHQVTAGAADKSWGVHVARLAGVPDTVIERARDLLLGFETAGAPAPGTSVRPRRRADPADQMSLFGE